MIGSMPVLFELVVNFGANEQAVQSATEGTRRLDHIEVRGVSLPLNGPFVSRPGSPNPHTEWSVFVGGMGVRASGPKPDIDPRSLTTEEITHVGHALYDLLGTFTGYRAAAVGWNRKSLVDIDDLETHWQNGEPPTEKGLVLADDLCDRWGLGRQWVNFSTGYRWEPYAGSTNIRWSGWHARRPT
jgi:hypothetical protein